MDDVIKLLEYWKTFTEKGYGTDLSRFGHWLNTQLDKSNNTFVPNDFNSNSNIQAGFLLGHIIAYFEVWTKVTFRDLPIQHFHDFGTLKFILDKKNPTKKEIAEDSFMEQSSCFESLKRMTKNRLIVDIVDKKDKRVKRVSLTAMGKKTLNIAISQVFKLSDLLVGDLNEKEKKELIKILGRLHKFHDNLYQNTDKAQIAKDYL